MNLQYFHYHAPQPLLSYSLLISESMLLRSSSTPVLGSLLSSFAESPNNAIHSEITHVGRHLPPLPTTTTTVIPHNNHKLSVYQTSSLNRSSCSSNSSPISPSIAQLDRNRGFRRAQSDGNLKDLAYASSKSMMTLETIPSFSFFSNRRGLREEEDEESEFEEGEEKEGGVLNLNAMVVVSEEVRDIEKGSCGVGFGDEEMYLAMGLGIEGCCGNGIGGCGGGGGGDYSSMWSRSGGDDGERKGVEEYYKKMVEENPGNPLFLRNYAQFLYECKRDHDKAEEYYSRAILADPKDGEVLSQYGKLVWEVHHDQNTASSYFERAVQASPQDSHVHAAYASFLWDAEEEEEDSCDQPQCLPPHLQKEPMVVSASA